MTLLGYFDEPHQREPAFDPGLSVMCPFCAGPLGDGPRVTTSFMREDRCDGRSWFYRAHKSCSEALSGEEIAKYEEAMLSLSSPAQVKP